MYFPVNFNDQARLQPISTDTLEVALISSIQRVDNTLACHLPIRPGHSIPLLTPEGIAACCMHYNICLTAGGILKQRRGRTRQDDDGEVPSKARNLREAALRRRLVALLSASE